MIVEAGSKPHLSCKFADLVATFAELFKRGWSGCFWLPARRKHDQMMRAEIAEELHRFPRTVESLLALRGIIERPTEGNREDLKTAPRKFVMQLRLGHPPSFENPREPSKANTDEPGLLHVVQDFPIGRLGLVPNIGGDAPFHILIGRFRISSCGEYTGCKRCGCNRS